MVSKKKPQNPSSNLSTTSAALKVSAFSPPALRLSLFASVVHGLDACRLRVHDIATSSLRCEHVFEKGVSVNSLSWGSLPPKDKKGARKKRKRAPNGAAAGDEDVKSAVVAAATNRGTVILFSPSEGAVVGVLEGEHIGAVRFFMFAEEGRGWSCGVDKKLVGWDIEQKFSLRYVQRCAALMRAPFNR
jgi:U3 small nucleolar RNA-associated protein 5